MNIKTLPGAVLALLLCATCPAIADSQAPRNKDIDRAPADEIDSRTGDKYAPLPQPQPPEPGKSRPGSIDGAIDLRGSEKAPAPLPDKPEGASALPGDNDGGQP
jgi:hypothetical protein